MRFFWLFYGGPRLAGSSSDLEFLGVNGVAKMEFELEVRGAVHMLVRGSRVDNGHTRMVVALETGDSETG